jgi:NHLM bacteriocin system ABC transporter peptidase/ATP-binding protein
MRLPPVTIDVLRRWTVRGALRKPRIGWLAGDWAPVRTRSVLQMEAVECGAASLAMILAYHGRHVPLEQLRLECGVSRDGSKASNLLKVARKLGMHARGLSAEPADLKKMPGPLIVFWNFNHFVVLEGFARGRAWLNDPAAGRRSVLEAEFDAAFTGVALVFEPGAEFRRGGVAPSVVMPLLMRLRGAGAAFRYLLLASVLLTVPGLALPGLARLFVDYYLVGGMENWLDPLIGGMAAAAVLRGVLTALQQHAMLHLQTRLSLAWSARFFWHVLRLPLQFFQQRFGGEIGARLALNDRVAVLVGGDLANAGAHLISALVFLFVMAQYNLWVTGAALAITVLNLVALWWNQVHTSEASQRLQMDQGKFIGAMLQGTQQIEAVKAAGAEQLLFERWMGGHAKVINAEQSLGRRRLVTNALPQVSAGLLLAAVLMVGGWQVMAGEITLGILVALQTLAAALNGPLVALVGVGAKVQEAQAFLRRLDDVLNHPQAPEFCAPPDRPGGNGGNSGNGGAGGGVADGDAGEGGPAAPHPPLAAGRVTLVDVTFGYSPLDAPLIAGLSLDILPGERVAVVGASGSGKSTVGKLVAGLNLPWSGTVLLDGRPLAEWPRAALRNSVALVDQDISLFEATVRDNITLWNRLVPDGWCTRAARDAGIHDAISQRAGAYNHPVQEGGRNFSVGERQRIEIARALVGQPRVLILDEATSGLDPSVEVHVMSALRRRGITCLIIAHRLSTVRDADRIIVLEQGRMVESGTHDSLLADGGYYSRLVRA